MSEDTDYDRVGRAANKIDDIDCREKTKPSVDLGICDTCLYCNGYERDLGNVYYKCEIFAKAIDFRKPRITRCRSFSKRGMLDISSMYNMAYLIEKDGKKTIQGFAPEGMFDDNDCREMVRETNE